jgi:hypothetical protein
MGSMMKNEPTYDQLVALVEYLAVRANYETLPILPQPLDAIKFCIENRKLNSNPFKE